MLTPSSNDLNHFQLYGNVHTVTERTFTLNHNFPTKVLRDEMFLEFSCNGKLLKQQFIEYNLLDHFDHLGFECAKHFKYREDAKLAESYSLNIKNEVISKSSFFYNNDITEIIEYMPANHVNRFFLIFSNTNNLTEVEEKFSSNFELINRTERVFDEQLDMQSENIFDSNNNLISSFNQIKKDGLIFKTIMKNYEKAEHVEFHYKYFFNQKITKVKKNNRFCEEWIKWYDHTSNIIKQQTIIGKYKRTDTINYKKDFHGNWIEKEVISQTNRNEFINLLSIREICNNP